MASVQIRAFVFTDIVGSTRLKKEMPGRDNAERNQYFAEQVLRPHRQRIEEGLAAREGRIISTQGDGHFLEFRSPIQAVLWAIDVQQLHARRPIATPSGGRLGVKVGIHMGPASADPNQSGNYIGTSVDYAARLVQLATEGKIVVSEVVATFVREEDIADIQLHPHGVYDLAGIGPKRVFEVLYGNQQPGPLQGAAGSSSPPGGPSTRSRGPAAATTTLQEPVTGLRIKDYELLEEIAEGGMGKVFKARHVGMGRVCVLKLIKDSVWGTGQEEVLERFYREIQIVARLKHPNIIQAYHSSSRDDDYHFLVMEYVDGITLDRLIAEQGSLPPGKSGEIVRQAAHGLQCIHEHGLVHRDIKPSNLMLTEEAGREVVKILDLGLALLVDDASDRLTQSQQRAMGTAYYMAPEQWGSSSVDIRADIYALGCTFYHLVTGRPPFQDSKFGQEHAHCVLMPRPPTGEAQLPEPLWGILQKMLAKRPEERFAEPREVCRALEAFSDASTLPPTVAPRRAPLPPRPAGSAEARRPAAARPSPPAAGAAGTASQRAPREGRGGWIPWVVVLLGLLLAVLTVGRLAGGSRRAVDSPAHAHAARHFLLTLPGLNGEWWFDEIPWFFPEIREQVLQEISVAQYQELAGMARQADVSAFYDRLRAVCESSLNANASDPLVRRFQLLSDAQPFDEVDTNAAESSIWATVADLIDQERAQPQAARPADRHLQALLHWKMRSAEADPLIAEARSLYHGENKELQALCIADAAVMMQRLRRWREAGRLFHAARSTLPHRNLAPQLQLFTLAMEAEVRLFDPSKPRDDIPQLFRQARADSILGQLDPNHPLSALLTSREALYYLETWQLSQAEAKGQEAFEKFAQLQGRRRAAHLYFRSRQFMALAHHFLGKSEDAAEEFRQLLAFIDDLLNSDEIADQEKPQWQRLKPNLLGRLGDVLLFGQGDAAGAAAVLETAAEEGRRFAGGPKTAYLARIHFKLAMALALAGQEEAAGQQHAAGRAVSGTVERAEQLAVFRWFEQVSAALQEPPATRLAAMEGVVRRAAEAADQDYHSYDRDDRQLLLFACNYVLAGAARQPGAIDQPQQAFVRQQKQRLSARVAQDGQVYLEHIAQAADRLWESR